MGAIRVHRHWRRTVSLRSQLRRILADLSLTPPRKILLVGQDLSGGPILACVSPARMCALVGSAQ
eukprot:8092759-Pyramimonas_sp.AAC.1